MKTKLYMKIISISIYYFDEKKRKIFPFLILFEKKSSLFPK